MYRDVIYIEVIYIEVMFLFLFVYYSKQPDLIFKLSKAHIYDYY